MVFVKSSLKPQNNDEFQENRCRFGVFKDSSSSKFDGNTAFYDGRSVPSPQPSHGPMPSFYSSKNRDAQTLLPLIVKQIYGRVCIKVGGITDITFVPNDDTGKIECFTEMLKQMKLRGHRAVIPTTGEFVYQGSRGQQFSSVRPVEENMRRL
ncbi:Replication protein A subunit B [Glycine max]|nr:Replication protein A subunit B [Glycine max]